MNVLSIQSWVAYGHVGNAGAIFPLQRLGAEVWAVNTVQFSNHPGYGSWAGRVFSGPEIEEIVSGVAARGLLAQCDAVLSGYMGNSDIGQAIVSAVSRVRAANPEVTYCCDPVIGDDVPGVYVQADIPDLLREHALPQADIATPNRFELMLLTGAPCSTLAQAKRAVSSMQARMRREGPRTVLLTSLAVSETPGDSVDMLVAEAGQCHLLRTPRLTISVNGAGDTIAALFMFHRLRTGSAAAALEAAGASIYGLLRRTAEAGSRELLTVAAQEEFVMPTWRFPAIAC